MKVKNIAFFGIMAAILGVGGAYAANDTIIASKGYVDAKTAGKQNTLNNGTNVVQSGSGNVVTGVTASDGTVTVTKGNVVANISDTSDGTTGNAVTGISASGNTITVSKGTFLTDDVIAQQGANDDKGWSENGSSLYETFNGEEINKKVPTMQAVEKRIKVVEKDVETAQSTATNAATAASDAATAASNAATAASNAATAASNAQTTANNAATAASDAMTEARAKWPSGQVAKQGTEEGSDKGWNEDGSSLYTIYTGDKVDEMTPTMQAVEMRVRNFVTSDAIQNLATATSNNGGATNKLRVVKYNTQGVITSGEDAGALATLSEITNDQVAVGANIDYTKMDGTLKDINDPNTDANCTSSSPCVLSFYKDGNGVKYVWTNMDLGTNQ